VDTEDQVSLNIPLRCIFKASYSRHASCTNVVAHAIMTMENFEIKGIWKGEYVYDDRFQPSVVKTSIPFILK
jgi:hypothetical protein